MHELEKNGYSTISSGSMGAAVFNPRFPAKAHVQSEHKQINAGFD